MIALHKQKGGFFERWIAYCENNDVPYKLVNCYDNDIIEQLRKCDGLMWHFSQNKREDILVAKQILFALEHTGFCVFPNMRTAWHFDDKVAQKYLLEAVGAPLISSYVFLDQKEALDWAARTDFPKVFKLRCGASSSNVQLVKNRRQAKQVIQQAFGKGFRSYNSWGSFYERWRKYRMEKTDINDVLRGVARLVFEPDFSRVRGRERGYVYFQEFLPDNDSDIRIVTVYGKALYVKRMVRQNDFRASGSGVVNFDKAEIDERCVEIALNTSRQLGAQMMNYDFIFDGRGEPRIVEVSYGVVPWGFDGCSGYWDEQMTWVEGANDFCGWMIEGFLQEIWSEGRQEKPSQVG